jgi:hypothetical protein
VGNLDLDPDDAVVGRAMHCHGDLGKTVEAVGGCWWGDPQAFAEDLSGRAVIRQFRENRM